MSEKDKKDLTSEDLLKKLMENFGNEPEEEGKQLSIEDAAGERSAVQERTYRYKKAKHTKEQSTAEQTESEKEDDDYREELERHIRAAEKYVEGMREKASAGEDQSESTGADTEETLPEEPEWFSLLKEENEKMSDESSAPQTEEEKKMSESREKETGEPAETVQQETLGRQNVQEVCSAQEAQAEPGTPAEQDEDSEEAGQISAREFGAQFGAQFGEVSEKSREEDPAVQLQEMEITESIPTQGEEKKSGDCSVHTEMEEEEDIGADNPENPEKPEKSAAEGKEDGQNKEEIDENEINLMMIFGLEGELAKKLGPEGLKKLKRKITGDAKADVVEEEYESPEQNVRFFEKFRKHYGWLTVRWILAIIAFFLVAAVEIFLAVLAGREMTVSQVLPTAFFDNPVFMALIAMQITTALLAIGYKEFLAGFKAIGTGKALPEIYLALTGLFEIVYEFGMLKCHTVNAMYFNLPLALGVLLAVSHTRLDLKRKLLAFKIVSTKRPKYAVTHVGGSELSAEKEAFGDFIGDISEICGTKKTSFITGFGRRSAKEPRYKGIIGVLSTVVVVIGLVFFVLGYYFASDGEKLLGAFRAAIQSVLFTVPLSAFLTYSLPFYKASRRAFVLDSAIIGEFSLEEYADATVISFDDKEVFPAKNVRVRSLKLYGDSRIDHVLYGAASVFNKLGGPLKEVFCTAVKESGVAREVDILEVEKDGVEAAVKGTRVYVGGSSFMMKRGLLPSVNPDDEAAEMEGRMSVMYLAIGGELAAKMYVEYKPDSEIESIMAALYKAGMCIGIRTLDPNIDDKMLRCHVDLSKYPVKVLKIDRTEKDDEEAEIDSGVVSKKGVKNLLKTLTSCRKVLQVIKADTVMKIVGIVVGIGVSVLTLLFGLTGEISSLWMTAYQLVMILPVLLVSLIFA